MNPRLIVIDGKTYNSVDEMPPDIRALYEEAMRNVSRDRLHNPVENLDPFKDRDGDGIADGFENMVPSGNMTGNVMSAAQFAVNGQTYSSIDQLPPEYRAQYEQAMGTLDANRNGIPDFVEGILKMTGQAVPTATATSNRDIATPGHIQSTAHAQHKPKFSTSAIEPESNNNWVVLLIGIAFVGLCLLTLAAGAWWYFFAR